MTPEQLAAMEAAVAAAIHRNRERFRRELEARQATDNPLTPEE